MKEILTSSAYFGVLLSLTAYYIGDRLRKKSKSPYANPLVISILLIIGFLLLTGIDYNTYSESCGFLNYLLTPVTVCLAIPLYEHLPLLKKNKTAVFSGILAGVLSSAVSILVMSMAFGLTHEEYITMLPKSITTAIAMGLTKELKGEVSITVAAITLTGNLGNFIAPLILKIFKINEPIAKGLACGTSSHAMGTAKAFEFGEVEGAMSSLSIAVAGIMTVFVAVLFSLIKY